MHSFLLCITGFVYGISIHQSTDFTDNVAVMVLQEYCPGVKNLLLLDSEGKRVAVKYYSDDWPTNQAKLAFEKSLFAKTQKTNARTEGMSMLFLI